MFLKMSTLRVARLGAPVDFLLARPVELVVEGDGDDLLSTRVVFFKTLRFFLW